MQVCADLERARLRVQAVADECMMELARAQAAILHGSDGALGCGGSGRGGGDGGRGASAAVTAAMGAAGPGCGRRGRFHDISMTATSSTVRVPPAGGGGGGGPPNAGANGGGGGPPQGGGDGDAGGDGDGNMPQPTLNGTGHWSEGGDVSPACSAVLASSPRLHLHATWAGGPGQDVVLRTPDKSEKAESSSTSRPAIPDLHLLSAFASVSTDVTICSRRPVPSIGPYSSLPSSLPTTARSPMATEL